MKLVELVATELSEWPYQVEAVTQDSDGSINMYRINNPTTTQKGSTWRTKGFHAYLTKSSEIASDRSSCIVTESQWQAERDRQKGGEWKRHRGGKQPVADRVQVEVKFRDGDVMQSHASDFFSWKRGECDAQLDILQYRIISQPQAEEVVMNGPFVAKAANQESTEIEIDDFIKSGTWYEDQIDGPIKWRDTILHCQAIIEDCEREIERNVQLLDSEGLMMQVDSKKAMQHYVPVTIPCTEWQDGDIVRCIETELSCADLTIGKEYTVVTRHGEIGVIDDVDDHMCSCIECGELEFVRRP